MTSDAVRQLVEDLELHLRKSWPELAVILDAATGALTTDEEHAKKGN